MKIASGLHSEVSTLEKLFRWPDVVWHRDVELDLRKLIGGPANHSQEWQPARVGLDLVEHGDYGDFGNAGIAVLDLFVDPLESFLHLFDGPGEFSMDRRN